MDKEEFQDIIDTATVGMNMKIKDATDFIIDEVTDEPYRIYKNPTGESIGRIIRVLHVENPTTGDIIKWYTIDFDHGIGEFTISEKDDITDERLRDIALYKRACIQQELDKLSSQRTRLDNRLSDIDKLLNGD